MTAARHIGKEAHDWERQAVLGLNDNSQPTYGFGAADHVILAKELRQMVTRWGNAQCVRAFGVSATTFRLVLAGSDRISERTLQQLVSRLPKAKRLFQRVDEKERLEIERVQWLVERFGLRMAARRLSTDHSNLRRKIKRLNSGRGECLES